MANDYLWVETDAALGVLCDRLQTAAWLALDTEFMRERTYYPQLCLVQVATPDVVACVDVLAIEALDPLFALLQDPRITKVLHSARQDLEMFYHLSGRVPAPIFDTQLAASFSGFADQAGYAKVVQALLGVTLEKTHTRADWSLRPLPEAVLQYAADDVRYLCDIYLRLHDDLVVRNRIAWLETQNARLTDPATYRPDPDTAWGRLRGLQRLNARQFAVAKALAAWRERQAMAANLPRQWIIKDALLTDLARRLPTNPESLRTIRGMQDSVTRKHGDALLAIITSAHGDTGPVQIPERLSAQDEALADALMAIVRIKGAEVGVSPAQLVTRADLEALARDPQDGGVLQGWRLETVGRDLMRFLHGKISLAVDQGALVIRSSD